MKKNYLLDMDGVLVRGRTPVAGAAEFLRRLALTGTPYLVLTNNPMYTQRQLHDRFAAAGLDIPPERFFTAALATAQFLAQQRPGGTAFVIGEVGLVEALRDVGYVFTDANPDYVVLGETMSYDFEQVTRGIRLVAAGARFIATNPDPAGPSEEGLVPECGAMAALMEKATGVRPYFVGKPNPLMMRRALNYLKSHSENTVMVGDRMDTDVVAGMEAGMETILVLSGVTRPEDVERYPYRPTLVLPSVAAIHPE
jgi:NagD protein